MGVSLQYVTKETASNLWRNRVMALAAVLTVAISLALVGTALLLRQAVNRQIATWGNDLTLRIWMQPGATSGQFAATRSLIAQTPQIKQPCSYLDKEQSYELARQVLAADPTAIAALTPKITPPVFRCQLDNPNDAPAVAAVFNGQPGIYAVNYPGQAIKTMQKVTSVVQIVLLVIAIVLLVSSLVLILNAIRMAIFARRREVGVMKLVGATNWFIRVPFMVEGLVQGLLGAVIAAGIVILSSVGVNSLISHYLSSTALPTGEIITTEVLVVLIGALVGVVGSSLAVRRFLDV